MPTRARETAALLAFIVIFLSSCENPLQKVIARDLTPRLAEIQVKYNDTGLESGDSIDFGTVRGGLTHAGTFTIENLGNADLLLPGSPRVTLSQSGSDFVVTVQPESPIGPGGSSAFVVAFTPTAAAMFSATVSIESSDTNEGLYALTIRGTGAIPNIAVKQGTTDIPPGTGAYGYGNVDAGGSMDVSFSIENSGNAELVLTGNPKVAIGGAGASQFSVTSEPVSPIAPGGSSPFTIRFQPPAGGGSAAAVDILCDDPNESPYSFAVTGTGTVPGSPVVSGLTPTLDTTPTWSWSSGVGGSGAYRYKLDNSDLTSGAVATTAMDFTPSSPLSLGVHRLYVQESNTHAVWSASGSFSIEVTDALAVGWIGGGSDGWKTGSAPSSGSDYKSFSQPSGVCVDGSGNIFVAEIANNRIGKWDSAGNALGWIGGGANGWQTIAARAGASDYQSFNMPRGVWVDSSGNIYVADSWNDRICKWDTNGNALGWIGGGSDGWQVGSAPLVFGYDYKSFWDPGSVCVDGSGNIYVADTSNNRICKWDSSGNAVGWIGGGSDGWKMGSAPFSGAPDYRSFDGPMGVYVDAGGYIYVADKQNHRISKWDSAGNALGWIGGGSDGWKTTGTSTGGSDYQSFSNPWSVFADGLGALYIADDIGRISRWSSSGAALGWIGNQGNGWRTGTAAFYFGSDYKSFFNPEGVCVDSAGNIYVADTGNERVSRWRH
jgi:sugar lactone lactonase YvrE